MSGEDTKLKENSRQAIMKSIIELYERGELHQHYERLANPRISGDEFQRCFDIENRFSIYFLAQLIEEATGESTAATDVYKLLTKKQQNRVIYPRAYSKETFFDLFKFIRSATKKQLQRYGHPAGLYFLARDMEARSGPAHPEQLHFFVGKKKRLQYLLGERASKLGFDWRPRCIRLSLSDIDAVSNFLKESYLKEREQFFNVYGSKAGCVFLACKLKISPKRLCTLLSKEVITAIILPFQVYDGLLPSAQEGRSETDSIGKEFERRFNPHPVRLSLPQVEVVLDFLRSAYKASMDAFFERYGSRLGMVHLARDLIANGACKQINLEWLSLMLHDSEMLFLLLSYFPGEGKSLASHADVKQIEFKTISSRFRPLHIALPLSTVETIIQFLSKRYNEDADSFFARYGCRPAVNQAGAENGVLALAKDLEAEGYPLSQRGVRGDLGKKIRLSHLENLISDGKELAKLLKIEDRRFSSSWNPCGEEISIERKEIDKDIKIYETWALWRIKAYKEIESHGLLSLIECDYEAYNKGSIDANALVRKLYFSECLEKIKKIGITIDKMANLVGVLISGKVFKKGKIAELNRAARAFDIYLTLQASGLIDELEVELQSYKEGNISAYTLAKRLYQNGILDKAFGWEKPVPSQAQGLRSNAVKRQALSEAEGSGFPKEKGDKARQMDKNVDSARTFAFALIASGLLPEKETVGLIWAFSSLDLFLAIKESGKLSELHPFIESYKKGEISAQTFAKELLSCGILSSLQDYGYEYDSINSVVLALVVGGLLEEEDRIELSRCSGHLDLYRWLQRNGFLNELRGLIEAYKSGKITEHAFVSKLYLSGILSKMKGHESLDESKKDVDSIATLVWAIVVGEEIPQSKHVPLGWESSTFDLYRDMERNGFIEELRPLAEAYNSGKVSKYAFIRQLHQTSILSKIQESGREVFSYVTLTNALVSGGLIPYDRKTALNWLSNAFDIFIELTEDGNISAYLQDYCDVLNDRIEGKEISPALYALHISLLHDSVNQILKRNGRDINRATFFHVLISGGIIDESLEFLISCAIGALNRAEALALRELYKSSSSFANFYRKMVDNWHSLREDLQSTYTKGAPPEKPFSNSYAWKIWSALSTD